MRSTMIFILCAVWTLSAVCQSTTLGLRIGNNGNFNLSSSNNIDQNNFGNGYQGGLYIEHRIYKGLKVRTELSHVNSSFAIHHTSHWPGDYSGKENYFSENIKVNSTAFNFSGNMVLDLGRIILGWGPEVSLITQASGRGVRSYESIDVLQPVQYRFFATRKQVYNRANSEEKFAYDASRILYGMDMNVNVVVYKPFSVQLKVFYAMNDFVERFTGFNNEKVNQQMINLQLSAVYNVPFFTLNKFQPYPKKKKRRS